MKVVENLFSFKVLIKTSSNLFNNLPNYIFGLSLFPNIHLMVSWMLDVIFTHLLVAFLFLISLLVAFLSMWVAGCL